MADVFLSYRSVDRDLADRLATRLRAAGHEVWFDVWRIDVGDSIIEKINEGLEGAVYVVVCYSSDGVDSPWMSREWMSTLARNLGGLGVKLLPARLSGDGRPPAILADVKYADLVQDWDDGVTQLLKAIR